MSTPFSIGSTWTSLALLLIALFTTRSTRSMIGAASLLSFSPAIGSKTSSSARRTSAVSPACASPVRARLALRRSTARSDPGCATPRERLVGIADLNRLENVAARRDDLLDAIAGLEFEILHQAEQQRIGHRHGQQVLLEADGDAHALERDVLRNEDDGGRIGRVLGKADVRKAELHRERFRDLLFGREVHPDEDDTQPLAGALVLDQRVFEIVVADEARLNQALTDFLAQSGPRPTWALWLEGSPFYGCRRWSTRLKILGRAEP